MTFERLRLKPRHRVELGRLDPADTSSYGKGKNRARSALLARGQELERLQELFYADARFGLLVVLQGMDTAGKDGTIRHVFERVNPQGVRVAAFGVPTPEERAHDFLWRIHRKTPERGEIVIFNRSQYEDVLITRVHHLVPARVWSKRYRAINEFERALVEDGVTVLKFFLHISRKEQRRRLQDRLTDPTKQWKINAADLKERAFWPRYIESYEEMLRRTSTRWAPWYIVPADQKWFRNLVVSTVLTETLSAMNLRYPKSTLDVRKVKID